ncbi:MAG: bacterioferritin [Anaerolineales bacterium]|nr:bacterioferritin [Anaerolineae bacterium]PWB51132.1 MAG: bacterioferritin [Anaerolineales bacterium]
MKGNEKILAALNNLLSDELTAISQYMVHAEMCDNWQFEKLGKVVEERAITEMKHAEKLIARILFLDGIPIVSNLKKISVGATVENQLDNDLAAEYGAVQGYNEGIRLAYEVGDNGTRELFDSILKDEEEHVDWLEAQIGQVKLMGLQTYLVEQVD